MPPADAAETVREHIVAMDALLDPIRSGAQDVPAGDARKALEAQLQQHLDAIAAAGRACTDDHPVMADALSKAVAFAKPELLEEAQFSNERARAKRSPTDARVAAVAADVAETGAHRSRMTAARRARIQSLIEPYKEQARAEAQAKPGERVQVRIPREGPLWDEIRGAIEDAGVREGLAVYGGHDLEFYYSVLELSHDAQTWWREGLADAGLSTSPAVYFHNDHSFNVFKAMLYVDDVGEQHGPFEYIPGSHRWERSATEALLVKSMDRANFATFGTRHESTRKYYRPHFESPEFRALVRRLPGPLSQTSHFGDDVLPDSELAEILDNERVTCLSAEADCIGFDGNALVHRGGVVRKGERWAIQLGFREPDPNAAPPEASRSRKRRGVLRRAEAFVRHKLKGERPESREASAPSARVPDLAAQRDAARRILAGCRLVGADVGAANGLQPHWAPFEGVAHIYAFEPDAQSFAALRDELAAKDEAAMYTPLRTALSKEGGPRTLYEVEPSTSSSLLPLNEDPDAALCGYRRPEVRRTGASTIQTRAFAEVLDEHGEDAIHLAKLDVQGAELEVLEGLGASRLDKLLLLESEVNTFEVYENQPTLAEFHTFCADHGLELFDARPLRFHATRDGQAYGYHDVFGVPHDSPDVRARIWHFDMVYLRSKERLIADRDPDQVRRAIVAFCGYGLFAEAYQLAERAETTRVLDTISSVDVRKAIEAWFQAARTQ